MNTDKYSLLVLRDTKDEDYGSVLLVAMNQRTRIVISFLLGVVNERLICARWEEAKSIRLQKEEMLQLSHGDHKVIKRSQVEPIRTDLDVNAVVSIIVDEIYKHPTRRRPDRDELISKGTADMENIFNIKDKELS